jgi:hypothetical protein
MSTAHITTNGSGNVDSASIKASIFSAVNKYKKSLIVEFFGQQVEIKQSSLFDIINRTNSKNTVVGDTATEDDTPVIIFILLNHTYIAGTEILLFDEADVEQLMSMPYGEDFNRVVSAYNDLSGIKVDREIKN